MRTNNSQQDWGWWVPGQVQGWDSRTASCCCVTKLYNLNLITRWQPRFTIWLILNEIEPHIAGLQISDPTRYVSLQALIAGYGQRASPDQWILWILRCRRGGVGHWSSWDPEMVRVFGAALDVQTLWISYFERFVGFLKCGSTKPLV